MTIFSDPRSFLFTVLFNMLRSVYQLCNSILYGDPNVTHNENKQMYFTVYGYILNTFFYYLLNEIIFRLWIELFFAFHFMVDTFHNGFV